MQELVYGRSARFLETLTRLDQYASSPWPILLLGETGVGKEMLARRIHAVSARRHGPFVAVNCAALPATLVESELFGHEKGAFSGADQASRGLVRHAHGGTLFLDEIGEMDLSLQAKLLRFLDSFEVRSVGATKVDRVDVRLVTATNVDLYRAVSSGMFRLDLLERLSVLSVPIPALRERPEDIPLLAEAILRSLGCAYSETALSPLGNYHWPGNVRQLRNFLVRASLVGRAQLTHALVDRLLAEERRLASRAEEPQGAEDWLDGSLAEIEKRVIVAKLNRCHGNRKQTARELGIAKSTLHEKLRRWRLESAGASADRVAHGMGLH